MISPDSIPGLFYFIACSSTLSHQETNHTSLLFFACLHFQSWMNTLYTTLTSRAIKTIVWTSAFSLCMFPTLQMTVSIRNNSVDSFCEKCVLWREFGFRLAVRHIICDPCTPGLAGAPMANLNFNLNF